MTLPPSAGPGPGAPVLVFDGSCGICTRSARWVEARLPPTAGVSVDPWQRLDLDALGLTPTDVAQAAWWIAPDGARLRGHRAAAAALRAIGGRWGAAGRLLDVPPASWLAALVYRLVAAHRHRLARFGSAPACGTGDERKR